MMQKNQMMVIGLGVLALSAATSTAQAHSLRCEAAELRIEARSLHCVSRCDTRYTDTNRKGDPVDVGARIAGCTTNCNDRFDVAMDRLHQSSVCLPVEPVEPNPMLCKAKLLGADARTIACLSRCQNRSGVPGFDSAECSLHCNERYSLACDKILASDICQGYSDETHKTASN